MKYLLQVKNTIIKILVALLMSQVSQQRSECFQISFMKGMTLDQFMTGLAFPDSQADTSSLHNEQQQNLYESSVNPQDWATMNKKKKYFMQGINQQSEDDLRESLHDNLQKNELPEQVTKATFREIKELEPKKKMNSTAYFGNESNQKNSFRVKHVSNSPAKKSKQTKLSNVSMTLYGAKFNHSKEKESKKLNQLVTFYGKNPRVQQNLQKQTQIKQRQSKKLIKKIQPLQLHDLFENETKTKKKFSNKICLPEIKIQGLKDKILQRKNRLC